MTASSPGGKEGKETSVMCVYSLIMLHTNFIRNAEENIIPLYKCTDVVVVVFVN